MCIFEPDAPDKPEAPPKTPLFLTANTERNQANTKSRKTGMDSLRVDLGVPSEGTGLAI